MTTKVGRLLQYATQKRWALEERVFRNMLQVLHRHDLGDRLSDEEIEAATSGRRAKSLAKMEVLGSVAAIPIHGVIARRASMVNGMSQPQGTSIEQLRASLDAALADDQVETILLDIDSPGGSVDGLDTMAQEIREARGTKRIVALADGMMASAAYYLGAQAHEVFATNGTEVGSIGVVAVIDDVSRAFQNQGIDTTVVRSAPAKGIGVQGAPVDRADVAVIQEEVDAFAELFVEAVAAGRGISLDKARAWADGRVHLAGEAEQLGLIDGVTSPKALMDRLDAGSEDGVPLSNDEPDEESEPLNPFGAAATVPADRDQGDEEMTKKTTDPPKSADIDAAVEARLAGLNADQVRASCPEAAKALLAAGAKAERERSSKILGKTKPTASQLEIASKHVTEGTDYLEAYESLLDDPKRVETSKAARLAAIQAADEGAVGPNEDPDDVPTGEEAWKREWDGMSADGREEFFNDYQTFKVCKELSVQQGGSKR